MLSPKILITTYHQAFFHKGGGEFELFEVAINLKKLGVLADVYGPNSRSIDNYDVILHFSVHSGGLELLRAAKEAGKAIVLWPNLWGDWSSQPGTVEIIRSHVGLADAVVLKSQAEHRLLSSIAPLSIPTRYVPVGVDACFSRPPTKGLFSQLYGISDFLLWVGIIEGTKNQLFAIDALRELPVPMVFVGEGRGRAYLDACRAAAPDHFLFVGEFPHKSHLLRAALAECKAYVEVSLEPAGKSALEAAIAGAQLVLSDDEWSREHFADQAIYVDPRSSESIRAGVTRALRERAPAGLATNIAERHKFPDVLRPLLPLLDEVARGRVR